MSVFDADTFSKNDLIGMFQFDMLSCYYKKNHEIHNQWVGINDPLNEKDKGLQGYMKLSIAVLGPGDKLKVSSIALCTLVACVDTPDPLPRVRARSRFMTRSKKPRRWRCWR